MTNEELLRDYISYHYVEGNIDNEQRIKMEFAAADYLQKLKQLNIHSVSSSNNFKKTLVCKDGTTWHLTDKEVETWEKDGSIKTGDKLYRTVIDTLY